MASTNVWINKSGNSYPVKNTMNGANLGTITKNEIFGAVDPLTYDHAPDELDPGCVFRNSSGQRVGISSTVSPYIVLTSYSDGLFTPLSDYPYSTVTIGSKTYKTFKARRTTTIYTPNGSIWGYVAADCLIALATTKDGNTFSGDTNMDYIAVAYVKSSSGEWVKASGDGLDWCFAPIGLDYGSGASSVNFIGTF